MCEWQVLTSGLTYLGCPVSSPVTCTHYSTAAVLRISFDIEVLVTSSSLTSRYSQPGIPAETAATPLLSPHSDLSLSGPAVCIIFRTRSRLNYQVNGSFVFHSDHRL